MKKIRLRLAWPTVALLSLVAMLFYFFAWRGNRMPATDSEIVSGMELVASFDFNEPAKGLLGAGAKAAVHGRASYRLGQDGTCAAALGKKFWLEVTREDGGPLLAGLEEFTVSYDSKPKEKNNAGWTFFASRTGRPQKYQWESYLGVMDKAESLEAERFHNFGRRPPGGPGAQPNPGWRHVDITFAKDATKLYINGVLADERASEYSLQEVLSEAGGFLYIGRASWGSGEYYAGLIDNFKIWKPAGQSEKPEEPPRTPITAVPPPETEAYLFAHFTGTEGNISDEQIYFSVSRDGRHWQDLRPAGKPVLESTVGELGVRDPYILRSPAGDTFYLIATDLSVYRRGGWGSAGWQTGSTKMVIWESTDLVHWEDPRPVDVAGGIHDAGMLWAPEAVYDSEAGDFFVFWATLSTTENKRGDAVNIFYSRTTDFRTFTKPTLWIDEESGVIDTTVIRAGDAYYRASRCDGIVIDQSDSLTGAWQRLGKLEDIFGKAWTYGNVEGPEFFLYNKKDHLEPTWGLLVDQYSAGKGYTAFRTKDIGGMVWEADGDMEFGEVKKRHGGILPITPEEYDRLVKSFSETEQSPVQAMKNPILPGEYADPDIACFGGKYYIYPTTDGFDGWSGWQFKVFSSDDLSDWKDEGVILDLRADVPWSDGSAWAPAIAEKNGRYYFYFCGNDPADNRKAIGVAVADAPTGPFTAQPAPLLTYAQCVDAGIAMGQAIDPQIFTEDDGTSYMLFGNGEPAIVTLGDDMVSWIPGTMKNLRGAAEFREAIAVNKIEDRYHFTWSCNDTGDENYMVRYGIADALYGPIAHKGILLQKDAAKDILGTGHHAILYRPAFDDYHIVYHRFLTPLGQVDSGFGFHREVCIDRLEYKDGRFRPVRPS